MGYAIATRLHCAVCGAEVLVTQPGSGVLKCCESEMSDGSPSAASTSNELGEAGDGD